MKITKKTGALIFNIMGILTLLLVYSGCSKDDDSSPKPDEDSDPSSMADFKPLLAYDMSDGTGGENFLTWKKSVYDATHAVSNGKSVKISTFPGETLPTCSGSAAFAGRTRFSKEKQVPPGKTLWFRVMHYIPSTFSFGHKYSANGDKEEAKACGQHADGNRWIKWMVLSPTLGHGRVYLLPSGSRRALEDNDQIRILSEARTRALEDFDASFPKDRWFSLQIAVKLSTKPDGSDGFLRSWIDETYLGEVTGRPFSEGSSVFDWGIGNYWNGIPWTDGVSGRTDFWIDEIIFATDMDGYGAPKTKDSGGRPFIHPDVRVKDLNK